MICSFRERSQRIVCLSSPIIVNFSTKIISLPQVGQAVGDVGGGLRVYISFTKRAISSKSSREASLKLPLKWPPVKRNLSDASLPIISPSVRSRSLVPDEDVRKRSVKFAQQRVRNGNFWHKALFRSNAPTRSQSGRSGHVWARSLRRARLHAIICNVAAAAS